MPKPAPLPREALSLIAPQASSLLSRTSLGAELLSEPPKAAKAIAEFDRFELLGRVSASARADVFLARDKLSRNPKSLVALKLLKGSSGPKTELPPLHLNLCDVYEQGESEGREFVAMEWVDGTSLATALQKAAQKGGMLDPTVLAAIFAQVARGIERMHQVPSSARAKVEPAHVMLQHDGVVKLLRSASKISSSFKLGKQVEELEACLRSLLVQGHSRALKLDLDSMAPHVPLAKAPLTPELDEALQRARTRAASNERIAARVFAEELEAYVEQTRGGDLSDVVMAFMKAVFPDPRTAAPALHTGIDLREEIAKGPAPASEPNPRQVSAISEKSGSRVWLFGVVLAVITASSMWVLLHRGDAKAPARVDKVTLAR